MRSGYRIFAALGAALLVTLTQAAAPTAPKNPDAVKNALRILAYVQSDMASKLPSHAYARLPHESQEFEEASAAMHDAVASDPPAFRAKVEAAMKKALAASRAVAEISKTNDEAKITSSVAAVDAALKELNALFPQELHPVPGQLGRPPGMGPGGPPPGLR